MPEYQQRWGSGYCSGRVRVMMKLYVGNLPFSTTDDELRTMFQAHGEVASATIVMDRETGRPRGFGFVEMSNDDQAKAAIEAMSGTARRGGLGFVNMSNHDEPKPPIELPFM